MYVRNSAELITCKAAGSPVHYEGEPADKTHIEENLDVDLLPEHIAEAEHAEPEHDTPDGVAAAAEADPAAAQPSDQGRLSRSPDGRVAGSIASPEAPKLAQGVL